MPKRFRNLMLYAFACTVLLGTWGGECARASDFAESFDGDEVSWRVQYNKSQVRLLSHRRHEQIYTEGRGSENFQFDTQQPSALIQLEHKLPQARVIDDVNLSLKVQSNRGGAMLFLRLVLPRQQDPRTGGVLSTYLPGETYLEVGKWQTLTCSARDRQVRSALQRLRARLNNPNLNTGGMYVDQAVLTCELRPGTTDLFVDDLQFGPVISPNDDEDITRLSAEEESANSPVEFRLDRLLVEERPFFPRLLPYHSEPLDQVKQAGINVAWIPDFEDTELLEDLRRLDMWAMATPPRAVSDSGEILDAKEASLLPFGTESTPILFWYLGTRIPPDAHRELIAWNQQIRGADRQFNRPLMADVTGSERVFSRHVSMLGVSRHLLNTSFSFKRYRDWMLHKRKLARPGSFSWTWVQTEAVSANVERREAARKSPIVVEPEQIRLQVYTALASGCRGIGYWKTTPLDAEVVGAAERRLAIAQLNLELELLEPWLSTGNLVGQIPFQVERRNQRLGRRNIDFRTSEPNRAERNALLGVLEDQRKSDSPESNELEAAVIRSDYGLLLLPIWYERGAQFVPGQMAANDATMIVPGVDESASAWEVTSTGIRSLARERVTGGLKIVLPKFDQTAAIILSSDRDVIARLRSKMESLAAESGRLSVELAREKLKRVAAVDEALRELGVGQPDAPQILAKAQILVQHGESAQGRDDYQGARQFSTDAMQLLRILQRAHWNDAIRNLSSPTSSPHAICFQTLPDHWRMIERLGRSPVDDNENLLRSGDFEDIDTMVVEGWRHSQNDLDGIRAAAELYPDARKGKFCLRLVAVPATGEDPPAVVERSPVTVTTPPMTVRHGQVVHISGWVRVVAAPVGTLDGALLYDSQTGPAGAIRWYAKSDWQRFELIREIQESGSLTLTMALNGLGEVQFDDLRVVPHNPGSSLGTPLVEEPEDPSESRANPLNFLNRLPKLRPMAPRR